jgi:flagellar P-ring protein precursor FlgI
MVFVYIILCMGFSLSVHADADEDSGKPKDPQPITERKIIRSSAASNKNLKVRIKDIARFAGIRDNQLVGYGLVVGLNGTGDTLSSSPYTKESLIGMLERLGVNIRDNTLPSGKNVAAVMVTAKLPPFAHAGTTIDIVVSALGDAKDLNGGTLLVTPLMAADGEVYAVGQGEVIVSGTSAQGVATSQVTGIPTTAKIPNGAIVEKEIAFQLTDLKSQTLSLRSPDLTTAKRMAEAVNGHFHRTVATTQDSASINIEMPRGSSEKIIEAMTQIEQLEIEPDQIAKVIIDPSGVIVLGNKVRISAVALTHGSVTVRIAESASVSQPNPFTQVVNPLANNPGASIGLGMALNGQTTSTAAPATVVQTSGQVLGTTIPTVIRNGVNIGQIGTALAALPAKASLTAIAAAIGTVGAPNAAEAPVAIPAGTTVAQIVAAIATLPVVATPVQIASAIGGIIPAPAVNNTTTQTPTTAQPPSMMNAALNTNTPLQQATVVNETKLKIEEQKGKFAILDAGADLEELVNALNILGTSPREMAQILQSIKAAGALHAEVIVS